MWLKRGLLALAKLVVKGKEVERLQSGLCGSCSYYVYGRCRSMGCVYASGNGGPPLRPTTLFPGPERKPHHFLRWGFKTPIPVDLTLWGKEPERETGFVTGGWYPRGKYWSERFEPVRDREARGDEEWLRQKIDLWNRHVVECERNQEKVMDLDLKRRAMQYLLDMYNVPYSPEYVEEEEIEVDLEKAPPEEVEEVKLLGQFMVVLTQAMKEFHDHGNKIHYRPVEGA